ncbi:ATP-grasp ribosomal peptide maturase [Nonomuraea sp. SBT364]|uniref:ATP-grasp ribosomal peptide maturase n=1 Tax=Nonomuraea sp. SBT364 TaxID=1580530 RepID=UPI00066ED140|nr:ATP-grasp ribosomal peptide maturase [Nonomuraea sp. SBT364]
MTVLVVSCVDDPTADLVLAELRDREVPVVRFDPGADFPHEMTLSASIDGIGLTGSIDTATRHLELLGVQSVYWRHPTPYRPARHLDEYTGQWVADQSRFGLGGILAMLPGARYLNHPWRNRDAEHKPVQLATAVAAGLKIPRTLVTNSLDSVQAFVSAVGGVVYKPLWSTPYRNAAGEALTVWAHVIDADTLDERVGGAAHLFQERVRKVADVRATMVGETAFSVRIDGAPELDWRCDYPSLAYTLVATPPAVVRGMRAYLDAFRLDFGAFDFSLTHDGEWVFLECNPNGQWGWFDPPISQLIAHEIADHLTCVKAWR